MSQSLAKEMINFINKSPSPFHAVKTAKEAFLKHGFEELKESDPWQLRPNSRVLVTKNGSTLFAVCVGGRYQPGNGFTLFGAHTDSPCLRPKPCSKRYSAGMAQVACETYGGGLWYTWFDRDLALAGRCLIRGGQQGSLEQRLVHLDRPIAILPSLAVHMQREVNSSFGPNAERELVPVLCLTPEETDTSSSAKEDTAGDSVVGRHAPALVSAIARELNCKTTDILEIEMSFAPHQSACLGGHNQEFVFAPRLDNLFNTFCGMRALVDSLDSLAEDPHIRMAVFYDHEEIGSCSAQGANSAVTRNVMQRVLGGLSASSNDASTLELALSRSFLLSADQAHAQHPNYPDKHEQAHRVSLNGGVVLKYNQNQRYATSGLTAAIVRMIATTAGVPVQEFCIRQDTSCGSTIGPILGGRLGVYTVDTGSPQLAMHSAREMCTAESVAQACKLYTEYFRRLPSLLASSLGHQHC